MTTATINQVKFTDSDVINIDDYIPAGDYNPHNVRPFLLHDHGFTVVVVFASCLQDALDIAVDENKLDNFRISDADLADYNAGTDDEYGIAYLGNAGEPFDIESLSVIELTNPKMSFAALFNASN